jgi:AcrR family transcriptional regulator
MARPPVITKEQILQAARGVFLKKGIRATTAEVAKRAGIAEGSIFNRFDTKYELFCAAMHVNVTEPAWFRSLESAPTGHPQQVLVKIATEILGFLRTLLPLIMMTWSNPSPSPSGLPSALATPNALPLRALQKVTDFFEQQMRAGKLRRQDPEITARVFLGSLQNYVFFELLLKAQDKVPLPAEKFVKGMVETLWKGLNPRSKKE